MRCGNLPFENGEIPSEALRSIGEGSHRLYGPAASAYVQMRDAALRDGVRLSVTDSYRSLEGQIACRAAKGSLCATPGTSKHGCGLAIDVGSGREWVQSNGSRFGWIWPLWARSPEEGGSKYEPWHFEYRTDGTPEGSGVADQLGGWKPTNPLVPDEVEEFGHFLSILANPEIWARVGWTVGGAVAIVVGLYLIGREFGLPSAANLVPAGRIGKLAGAVV